MEVPEAFCEPLRRVLGWLLSLRDASGRIVCPAHRIEHTGKSAGVIVMACELMRCSPKEDREALLEVAIQQAERLVSRLEREPSSTCFTFRPGRHDPFNCSNSVIDGAACSDALAELVLNHGQRLSAAQRTRFRRASVLHAQTYLRYAILDKGIPAQKAWAMTGVAGAWKLAGHEVLELAVREGERLLAEVQHADGSFPYHPLAAGADHPGASDVSAFYQSRVTAFSMFALERIGLDPAHADHRAPLQRGLEFLLGLSGPDGLKCGLLEAKPWYWGAAHEVASHPFDVFALARGFRHFGDVRLARAALRAWRVWEEHLGQDGRPADHEPGPGRRPSYQCPLFWAGHASWMARSLADLAHASRELEGAPQDSSTPRVRHFPQASLTRLDDGVVAAWVRGARPPVNVLHGSPRGAGLLRVISRGGEDLLARAMDEPVGEAEWQGSLGGLAPLRGWRSGAGELRFSLWLARNAWRAGRRFEATAWPASLFARGVCAFAGPRVASSFALAPTTELDAAGLTLEGHLAWRDGSPVPDTTLRRSFSVDGEGLWVEERLVAAGGVRGLDYRVPERARAVEREPGFVRYRLG